MSGIMEECPFPVNTRSLKARCGFWFFNGLCLFCLGFFLSIADGINMADASWFLQVTQRVTSGDVLYRDVFFGSTPLSVYLTALFTTIFGTEILVVKGVMVLCNVLTILLSCRLVQQLGAVRCFPFIMVMALIVYAPPECAVYQPLANLFLMGCFYAALLWRESVNAVNKTGNDKSTGALAAAGLAAGLCFASKQNIGIYALAALLLMVAFNSGGILMKRKRKLVDILIVLSSFLLASVLVFFPVWSSGGTEKLIDYGFINKGTYIRLGGISYLDGLNQLVVLLGNIGSLDNLKKIYLLAPFLLPFLTFGALLADWLRSGTDKRNLTLTVILFVGAAFLGLYPRAGRTHLTYVIPELLIGLTYVWYRTKPHITTRWIRLIKAGLVVWFGIGLGFMLINPLVKISTGNYQLSTLPHFRGVLINTDKQKEIYSLAPSLTKEASNEQAFILSPHAGFYYLVSGLKNPTSFDYPLATAFGRNGESEVMAAISRREIHPVFLDSQWPSPALRPVVLETYVQEHMERSRDFGEFTLYRTIVESPGG